MRFSFEVPGKPVGQGNLRRSRDGGLYHANAAQLMPWRESVGWHALARMPHGWDRSGPMGVEAVFHLPRPKHHRRATGELMASAPWWPVSHASGDTDHYARALLDALAMARIYDDDSQVVQLHAEKVYGAGAGRLLCTVQRLTERG